MNDDLAFTVFVFVAVMFVLVMAAISQGVGCSPT